MILRDSRHHWLLKFWWCCVIIGAVENREMRNKKWAKEVLWWRKESKKLQILYFWISKFSNILISAYSNLRIFKFVLFPNVWKSKPLLATETQLSSCLCSTWDLLKIYRQRTSGNSTHVTVHKKTTKSNVTNRSVQLVSMRSNGRIHNKRSNAKEVLLYRMPSKWQTPGTWLTKPR